MLILEKAQQLSIKNETELMDYLSELTEFLNAGGTLSIYLDRENMSLMRDLFGRASSSQKESPKVAFGFHPSEPRP